MNLKLPNIKNWKPKFKKTNKRKSNKKKNILSSLTYTILIIPLFLFISQWIWTDEVDRYVFGWLTILIVSLFSQFFLFRGVEYRDKIVHFLYIVFSIVITMFFAYFIHKYVHLDIHIWDKIDGEWLNQLCSTLLKSVLLFLIKTVLWIVISMHSQHIGNISSTNERLFQENKNLKEELEKIIEEKENAFIKPNDDEEFINRILNSKEIF